MKHNFIALAAYAVILLTQFFQLSPVNANENSSQFYGYKGDYYNISNDKIAYNGQTYLQNKFLMQNEKVSEQLTYIRPNIELDTLKIEKSTDFEYYTSIRIWSVEYIIRNGEVKKLDLYDWQKQAYENFTDDNLREIKANFKPLTDKPQYKTYIED